MILIDTNVLSELMGREPDARVLAWLDEQPAPSVWTSAITVFEIAFGIGLLPASRRRKQLESAFARTLGEGLNERVLAFDEPAAIAAGAIAAGARRAGRSIEIRDIQIAGIAAAHRAQLATRNTRHFEALGIKLVNPWAD